LLAVAIVGLGTNLASALVLMRGGGHEHERNLNVRGAFLHVVADALGSVGAIVGALVMLGTGWYLADPLLSAGIGMLILWSSWKLLRESVDVLLEATPKGIDATEVRRAVAGVHDLHIWTVTSGLISLSAHVEVMGQRPWPDLLKELTGLFRERFGIAHVTLQPEEPTEAIDARGACSIDTEAGREACRVALATSAHAAGRHHTHAH
jgi:cobalt-zinc-cadmium efflux system protein